MIQALQKFAHLVLLIALLGKVKEFLVLLQVFELCLENLKEELVERLQEELEVNRFEATEEI